MNLINQNNHKSIGALILGGDFQGLGIIRCLYEYNVPCFVVDYEIGIAKYSRYVKRSVYEPNLLDENYFVDYLIGLAKKQDLKDWVLYATKDEMLKIISINLVKLKEWFKVPLPGWDVVQKFYFKEQAYKIAESIGIPIPKIYDHSSIDDLLRHNLQFPLVLKPSFKEKYYPITKKKAIRVNNIDELKKEYSEMNAIIDTSEIVVQEMIEGGTKNLFSYATYFDGEKSIGGITAVRLRQHPMDFGHATTYAVSVFKPELFEMGNKILKAIGYSGIAEVEFMWDDREKVFKFIEINGRFWGWHTLAREAGINFPFILYQHMLGQVISTNDAEINAKWVRLLTDLPTVFQEIFKGRFTIKDYIASMKGKKRFAVFSINDPLPFFVEILLIPYLWIKRGF
jgi:predicted ATP-grasp superfamily ATP-dependent carboligase